MFQFYFLQWRKKDHYLQQTIVVWALKVRRQLTKGMWVRTKMQAALHLSGRCPRHQPRLGITSSNWFSKKGCLSLICPWEIMPFSNWSGQKVCFFWLVSLEGCLFSNWSLKRRLFFWFAVSTASLASWLTYPHRPRRPVTGTHDNKANHRGRKVCTDTEGWSK